MKGIRQLKSGFADPRMKELIDTLWREYYGLYVEKYNRDPEKWLLNVFSPEIDFGQAIGQDHLIEGNRSVAIGQGLVTKAFMELALGAYGLIPEGQDPEEWNPLDLLFSIGNGPDQYSRSNALEIYKSGLIKLHNALKLADYNGDLEPENGMLQYSDVDGIQVWEDGAWKDVKDKTFRHTQTTPARVWEVYHNLGKYPSATIKDAEGNEYEAEVKHIDLNILIITFSEPFSGVADLN